MTAAELARRLIDDLRCGRPLDASLDALLDATGARATGLWRVDGEHLNQLGFRGRADMPDEVKRDFAAATRRVSLEMTGLGIVRAVLDGAPVVMRREPGNDDLSTSPGWLARFDCLRSLVVPIRHEARVVGAIAISTNGELATGEPAWMFLASVADGIGPALSESAAGSA